MSDKEIDHLVKTGEDLDNLHELIGKQNAIVGIVRDVDGKLKWAAVDGTLVAISENTADLKGKVLGAASITNDEE